MSSLSKISELDQGLYRTVASFYRSHNDGLTSGLKTLSTYSSSSNRSYLEWRTSIGLSRGTEYCYNCLRQQGDGSITRGYFAPKIINNLFGVKYLITEPHSDENQQLAQLHGYSQILDGDLLVYQNGEALPLGFVVPTRLTENDFVQTDNMVKILNEFSQRNLGKDIFVASEQAQIQSVFGMVKNEKGQFVYDGHSPEAYLIYIIDNPDRRPYYYVLDAPNRNLDAEIYDMARLDENGQPTLIGGENLRQYYLGYDENLQIKLQLTNLSMEAKLAGSFVYEDIAVSDEIASQLMSTSTCQGATDSEITCKMQVGEDGSVAFFTIPYESSWRITIDGQTVASRRVLGVFLATDLPAGEHEVRITYRPRGLNLGTLITLLSVGICIVIIVACRARWQKSAQNTI